MRRLSKNNENIDEMNIQKTHGEKIDIKKIKIWNKNEKNGRVLCFIWIEFTGN